MVAAPIIVALTHRAVEGAWARYGDALRIDGASRSRTLPHLLAIVRAEVMTAVLAGFRPHDFGGRSHPTGRRQYPRLDPNHDDRDRTANEPGLPLAGRRPWRSASWH